MAISTSSYTLSSPQNLVPMYDADLVFLLEFWECLPLHNFLYDPWQFYFLLTDLILLTPPNPCFKLNSEVIEGRDPSLKLICLSKYLLFIEPSEIAPLKSFLSLTFVDLSGNTYFHYFFCKTIMNHFADTLSVKTFLQYLIQGFSLK